VDEREQRIEARVAAFPEGTAAEGDDNVILCGVSRPVQSVDAVLRQAAADLNAIGARWAVIGGLAVAFRAEPRFTKDVDVAVAVADDREAEDIVNRLQVRGYALASLVEQDYVNLPEDLSGIIGQARK